MSNRIDDVRDIDRANHDLRYSYSAQDGMKIIFLMLAKTIAFSVSCVGGHPSPSDDARERKTTDKLCIRDCGKDINDCGDNWGKSGVP